MDEFDFITKLKPSHTFQENIKVGIGDDAAVYDPSISKSQVVCVDTMVEGVHFLKHLSSPQEVGYKALAVNISDIAAMGAIPLYYLVSIAIPSSWQEQELLGVFKGMAELAETHKMDLIGGDTVATTDKLTLTVTVIGEVERHVRLLRSEAKEGDIVFVTGFIGDSSAGLAILLNQITIDPNFDSDYLVRRHKRPVPRVKAGRLIAKVNRASLNDISDGLASELHEIAEASQIGITINKELLPISGSLSKLGSKYDTNKWMLYGGEDFELVGTTSFESWQKLSLAFEKEDMKITRIGIVTGDHTGVRLNNEDREIIVLEKSGYNHFK